MQKLLIIFIFTLFFSCGKDTILPKQGMWKATLAVQDDKKLPFLFNWKEDQSITIYNAEERINITDISINGDSIEIAHPVFEGVFKGTFTETSITGNFIKPSLDRVVPFIMNYGAFNRFETIKPAKANVTGNWEMVFSADSPADRYIAKGIFTQTSDQKVTGTIQTTTGDYRYLDGVLEGTTLQLSTFDGAHAFLFEAEVKDSVLSGNFYSGNHWKEPFRAKRNATYKLPDENKLTYLKEGYEHFDFSFPDENGTLVSLQDDTFKDKVVVVQIMGTWCPNCLEETQYYTQYLKENPSSEVAFVSLAFEYAPTKEQAFNGIKRLRDRIEVPYPILLAQYGSSNKQKANEKLPMLNHVLSYPTTVFIDKKGTVRKIHTGFNGKATGDTYVAFVNEFETFLEILKTE